MNAQPEAVDSVDGWFKSSRSNPSQACVEMRFVGANVQVRDSKELGHGPILSVSAKNWAGFLAKIPGFYR